MTRSNMINFQASKGLCWLLGVWVLCSGSVGSVLGGVDGCIVTGFKMKLKSGYDPRFISIIGREPDQVLNQNDLICRSGSYGDTIEAITEGCGTSTSTTTNIATSDGIHFLLRNTSTPGEMFNRTIIESLKVFSTTPPYYMYGNNGNEIYGKSLPTGRYRIVATPISNPTGRAYVDFDIIPCTYYRPRNECSSCASQNKACEGSICIGRGDIRVTLLTYGTNTWSYGLSVTTPRGTVVAAYDNRPNENDDYDGTSGHVDTNWQTSGCRSTGVWIKSILFNDRNKIPLGQYNINIDTNSICGFASSSVPNNFRYVLKIYVRGRLQGKPISGSGPMSFTFDY